MPQLTQAPELLSLSTLGYEWRRVAHNPGFGEIIIWFGDLIDGKIRNRFSAMIREGKVIVVTHRTPDGGDLFAKISKYYSAEKAHQDAIIEADRIARLKRNPFMSHHKARIRKFV